MSRLSCDPLFNWFASRAEGSRFQLEFHLQHRCQQVCAPSDGWTSLGLSLCSLIILTVCVSIDLGLMSAERAIIARKLTASRAGEGKPTPTSYDACSERKDCKGNHKRCRAKVHKTLFSVCTAYHDEYLCADFSNKNR